MTENVFENLSMKAPFLLSSKYFAQKKNKLENISRVFEMKFVHQLVDVVHKFLSPLNFFRSHLFFDDVFFII